MASGDPFAAAAAAAAGDVAADSYSSSPTPIRLREALATLSEAFESGGDTACSNSAAADVAEVLSASDAVVSEQMLREVHAFLSCPSSNQMAIDALSLELPKHVAELGARMGNCRDIAKTVIEFFVTNCNPRDMLSILCEALDTPVALNGSAYFVILLDGLARVLTLIQRRHIEQVKVVLPAVVRVMHAALSEPDVEHGTVDLFNAALGIGNAIQEMCKTMVNHRKEDLCSILGLYALQNIALVSETTHQNILHTCGSVVLQYSKFLTYCGFTYLGLLTGNDVTSATNKLSKEEDDDFLDCFSLAMHGASLVGLIIFPTTPLSLLFGCCLVTFLSYLTVVWTSIHDDVSKYAGAVMESALKQVQDDYIRKCEAINMFRYVLGSVNYPWVIKSHSIDLLLTLVDDKSSEETNSPLHVDFPYSTQFFATLKAIERVMITAPDALMRKKAFAALKRVISVVPSAQRFDILQALITNSMSPSLTAILLDVAKNEVLRESRRADQDCIESDRSQDVGESPPWASHALELVELILRPPEGGPPCLRDHSEQVLSALNLLRLILIIDSRGSRSAKLLRDETIQKVYTECLVPLRPAVEAIQSELENDNDREDDANQIMFLINPAQLVLQRCIELVEERMKGS